MKGNASKIIKRILKIITLIVIIIAIGIAGFTIFLLTGKNKTIHMAINPVNLQSVAEGTYKGSYKGSRFSNKVEVTVKDHNITDIKILKPVLFMSEDASSKIIDEIKASQKNDVDVVSGATASSKALLKAVEDALESNKQ